MSPAGSTPRKRGSGCANEICRTPTRLDAVADAAVEGRLGDALLAARQAVDTGTDPVVLVNALASVLRTLAKVGAAGRSAKSFELAGQLGMAPWQIDKARRQLAGWTPRGIVAAVGAIALADAQVKGAASDPIYALEHAISEIASARAAR